MALKWSILVPVGYSRYPTSPGQYDIFRPPATASSDAPPAGLGGFSSQSTALDYFVANTGSLLDVSVWGTVDRVSYPNTLRYGSGSTEVWPPEVNYLPDYGGFYTQFDYSITLQLYTCTVFSDLFPGGALMSLYLYQLPEASSPAVPPASVTIQLKRDNTVAKYSVKPSDAAVLRKYDNPVQFIRAKFATTRVAVITETITGGFMIYEEASLGVATGPVYIYSSKRKLLHIVDVSVINQYRLYTF